MKQYVATFFSHFGALRFQKLCTKLGYEAQLAPVPRSLSSSCGTCVLFSAPELEQLVLDENGYKLLYEAEE